VWNESHRLHLTLTTCGCFNANVSESKMACLHLSSALKNRPSITHVFITFAHTHMSHYRSRHSKKDFTLLQMEADKLMLPGEKSKTSALSSSPSSTALSGMRGMRGGGGWTPKAILFLLLWYFWSGCTLFLNKYVVFYMKGDATVLGEGIEETSSNFSYLGCSQMWVTMLLGLFQMRFPLGMYEKRKEKKAKPKGFVKNMLIVGSLR